MKTIELPDSKLLKKKYFGKLDTISKGKNALRKAEQLFRRGYEDFKSGTLSLDEFSNFGFHVFHSVAKRYPQSELFQASLAVSDLSFAVRAPAVYGNIQLFLEEADSFVVSSEAANMKQKHRATKTQADGPLTPETCSQVGYEWYGDTTYDPEAPAGANKEFDTLIGKGWKLGEPANKNLVQNCRVGLYKPITAAKKAR